MTSMPKAQYYLLFHFISTNDGEFIAVNTILAIFCGSGLILSRILLYEGSQFSFQQFVFLHICIN